MGLLLGLVVGVQVTKIMGGSVLEVLLVHLPTCALHVAAVWALFGKRGAKVFAPDYASDPRPLRWWTSPFFWGPFALVGLEFLAPSPQPKNPVFPPAQVIQPVERPLDEAEVKAFVASVQRMARVRALEDRAGQVDADMAASATSSRDRAVRAYQSLRGDRAKAPREIRAELKRHALAVVPAEERQAAEEIMGFVFIDKHEDLVFQASNEPVNFAARQQRELHKAAALLAQGKTRDDPQVQRHIRAAQEYGQGKVPTGGGTR